MLWRAYALAARVCPPIGWAGFGLGLAYMVWQEITYSAANGRRS